MPFYQLTQQGSFGANDIVNVHWYRSITPYGALLDRVAVMEALAAEWLENIWNSRAPGHVGGYGLKELMPLQYRLENLIVQAWDDSFVTFTTDPITVLVASDGMDNGPNNGPATCAIFHANLAPAFGPGIGLPTKGYLAVGPLTDAVIDSGGKLLDTERAKFQTVADRLATSIMTELPADELEPVRVRLTRVAGVVTDIGWKNVSSFVVQSVAKFRRSRLPEIGS